RAHRRFGPDPAAAAEPASIEGLDLVRDGDVGVQVVVAGAAIAVGESGRDQSLHVDLPDTVGAGAAKQGVLLNEGERAIGSLVTERSAGGSSGRIPLPRSTPHWQQPGSGKRWHNPRDAAPHGALDTYC